MSIRVKTFIVAAKDNGWDVKKNGRLVSHHIKKEAAIEKGRQTAKKNAPFGQLIIKKQNGKIQTEWTYGHDPRKTKG